LKPDSTRYCTKSTVIFIKLLSETTKRSGLRMQLRSTLCIVQAQCQAGK